MIMLEQSNTAIHGDPLIHPVRGNAALCIDINLKSVPPRSYRFISKANRVLAYEANLATLCRMYVTRSAMHAYIYVYICIHRVDLMRNQLGDGCTFHDILQRAYIRETKYVPSTLYVHCAATNVKCDSGQENS